MKVVSNGLEGLLRERGEMLYQRHSGVNTGHIAQGEALQVRKQLEGCSLLVSEEVGREVE